MPKIESPIGSRKFADQPMRDLEVPDASGYTPPTSSRQPPQPNFHLNENAMQDFQQRLNPPQPAPAMISDEEKSFREAKRAKRMGMERLSDGARRRIEMLVGMTRLTRTVELDSNIYVLQTLKSKELRDAIVAAAEFNGTVQFAFETRKQMLARSLTVIAGVEIENFLNSSELEDRLEFVEDMDHSLALRLYNEYVVLAKESEDKYAIKTEADAKEVIEDLKK